MPSSMKIIFLLNERHLVNRGMIIEGIIKI
jgi:hypothetical protein